MQGAIAHEKTISLAVLPLQNMSQDDTIDMFGTGFILDVITDLSRFRSFNIISYESIKNFDPDVRVNSLIFQDLKVDYVVKGLIRFHNDKLLINTQLVNAKQNRLVWAEKFKDDLEKIFDIEEELVEKIAVSLQHYVDFDVLEGIRKKPFINLNAYECWIRGLTELKKGTLEADEKAREFFLQAIEIDPHYARAYTGMSMTHFNEWSCQIWDRWEVSQKGAFEWAQKAVDLDERDHISMAILGRLYLFNGEYDKAEHFLRNALRLNPNDSENLIQIAFSFGYLGYLEEALQLYDKANRLNPIAGDSYFSCGAFLYFEYSDFNKAIELAEKHQFGKGWVDFPAYQAAAYYHLGQLDKMNECWQAFLQQFNLKINKGNTADSQTALKWMINVNPYKSNTQLKPFWEFISKDGLDISFNKTPNSIYTQYNQFKLDGELWTLQFAGKQTQITDLKGFHDISRLLSSPEESIHCTELMGAQVIQKGEEVFDEKAKRTYQKKILELQQELEEAQNLNDHVQIEKLQQEYDCIIDHLSKSTGMGGRTRKVSDNIEKARTAVTWRIRSAIRKISELHPQLGKHLELSIKTGLFCSYSPEMDMKWEL